MLLKETDWEKLNRIHEPFRRKVECTCFCICVAQERRFLNKGSWSRSCCIPTYSRHLTGPPPHPCLYDQLCAGLPRFPLLWRIALTCWTLLPGGFWVENLVLCSSAGHSQCCCDWSPLGIPPDGSWTDLQRPLMQQNEQCNVMQLVMVEWMTKIMMDAPGTFLEWSNVCVSNQWSIQRTTENKQ